MSAGAARRAVLIGNGVFPRAEGSLTPLAAPAHDVGVLAGILADADLCRFEEPQRLVDADATTVKKALLRTLETAGPADLVVIYYAGHGKLDGSQLYLCAHDTEPEALAATSISIRDIHHFVGRSACRQVVLILDCCFSGAAADEFQTRGEMVDRITAAAAPARGLYLLTSCGAYETALERGGAVEGDVPYGLYTRALVDGIVSGEADVYRDGRITPLELARYLQERIPGQTPRVTLIDAEGEEPVLAWTGWSMDDEKRDEVRERLAGWFADEVIPYDVMHEAMQLLTRVPRNAAEKRRRRLLALCTGAGWEAVFARAWRSLGDGAAPDDFERFLTRHAAEDELPERTYVEAMRLLAAEPANDVQRRLKLLLASFAREEHRDVRILLDAWRALERRRPPEPTLAPVAPEPPQPPPAAPPPPEPAIVEDDSLSPPPKSTEPIDAIASAPDAPTTTQSEPDLAPAELSPPADDAVGQELPASPDDGVLRLDSPPAVAPPPGFVLGDRTRPAERRHPGPRKPTPTPAMGAQERYARAELRFLKALGAGVLVIVAITFIRGVSERSADDAYYETTVVPDTEAAPVVMTPPVDTMMAMDTTLMAVTTPIVDVSAFTPALVAHVRRLGYEPTELLLDGRGPIIDRVMTADSTGQYHARQGGRDYLRGVVDAPARIGWDLQHQDFLARVAVRFEEGNPVHGAGLFFRGPGLVLLRPGTDPAYAVFAYQDEWKTRVPYTRSEAVRAGDDNRLEIAAIGGQVLVYVNDVHVSTSAAMPTAPGVRFDLRVDGPGTLYSFDDVVVVALSRDVTTTP